MSIFRVFVVHPPTDGHLGCFHFGERERDNERGGTLSLGKAVKSFGFMPRSSIAGEQCSYFQLVWTSPY